MSDCKCVTYPGSGHFHGSTLPETYGPCTREATRTVQVHTHYVSGGNPPAPLRGYTDMPMCQACAEWNETKESEPTK